MPLGRHGAAATFQQPMDRVLRLQGSDTATYTDDIIICRESWDERMEHVPEVSGALKEAGLTANPTKCQLPTQEVTYLG